MNLYSFIDKYILLPLADKLMRRGVSKEWRLLVNTDWMSELELINFQSVRLRQLITHCYANVPYYTKLFDRLGLKPEEIQTRDDLQKLPILTKQIIRDNYQDLISIDVAKRRIQHGSTGGSTGTPLKFIKDISTWNMAWGSSFRAWEWYDFHLGEKIFTLGGNSLVKHKKTFTPKNVFDKWIMRNTKRSSAEVDDVAMENHYKAFVKVKPKALRGYASSLVVFANYIEKNKLPVPQLKVILTTGEILMPQYRTVLQRVFKVPVFDAYGAGDGGIASHECYMHEGLHITEERCVIEITDKNGSVLPDGELGFVTTTDLGNYAFPFIRYQVGDMSYIKKDKCSCGRQSRLFGAVVGRAGKLLYSKQGVPISPTMLPIMLYRDNDYHKLENQVLYNKIDKFQIRQDKYGNIRILLKLKEKQDEHNNQFDYVLANFGKHFIDSQITLEFVDNIPTMPSGKEDYCVSEYEYKKL